VEGRGPHSSKRGDRRVSYHVKKRGQLPGEVCAKRNGVNSKTKTKEKERQKKKQEHRGSSNRTRRGKVTKEKEGEASIRTELNLQQGKGLKRNYARGEEKSGEGEETNSKT